MGRDTELEQSLRDETSLDSVSGNISSTMFSATWDTTTTEVAGSLTIIPVLSALISPISTINGPERAENCVVATFLIELFFADLLVEST
jgi:hypothetical protein